MAPVSPAESLGGLDRAFLERYDLVGPRYTSYPTAPEWTRAVGPETLAAHLATPQGPADRPLSIYLHLPFCWEHCTFCACNVIISSKGRAVSDPYVNGLEREIDLLAERVDRTRPVVQFHWGGGTPTYLEPDQLRRLHDLIASRFRLAPDVEQSVEVHVAWTTDAQLRTLAELGFNRLSLGVQDFDEATQRAINRVQSFDRTREITELARELGFQGINYDLVYGLPHQTEASWAPTLDKVAALRPDRIALYNFAYLPERLAHQRAIDPATLPEGETKFRIFVASHDRFRAEGYDYIGMDHFALPEDELARARLEGTLHRNFMGFSTRAGADLIAAGISAISAVGDLYAQNVKKLSDYAEALGRGHLPTERGYLLTPDDRLRRRLISDVMCRGRIETSPLAEQFGIDFRMYFAPEIEELEPLLADGLLGPTESGWELTFLGRLFARNVAMIFDAHLRRRRAQGQRQLFSRTL